MVEPLYAHDGDMICDVRALVDVICGDELLLVMRIPYPFLAPSSLSSSTLGLSFHFLENPFLNLTLPFWPLPTRNSTPLH